MHDASTSTSASCATSNQLYNRKCVCSKTMSKNGNNDKMHAIRSFFEKYQIPQFLGLAKMNETAGMSRASSEISAAMEDVSYKRTKASHSEERAVDGERGGEGSRHSSGHSYSEPQSKQSAMAHDAKESPHSSSLSNPPSSSTSHLPTPEIEKAPIRAIRQLSPLSSGSSSPEPEPTHTTDPFPPPATTHSTTEHNVSFMSTSSISALPISSQSSSRRIVKDGQLAVTNSDSDSADHEDEPLDEIEEMIRRKRRNMAAMATSGPAATDKGRELRSTRRDKPVTNTASARKDTSPPRKKYKFSLEKLVKESKREAAWSEKHKSYLDKTGEESILIVADQANANLNLDEVAEHLKGDDEDAGKKTQFMRAMKRMDAMEEEVKYHFTDIAKPLPARQRPEFPVAALKKEKTWGLLVKGE